MHFVQINKTQTHPELTKFALFESAFRPFFLAAGIYAALLLFIWMGVYNGFWIFSNYYGLTGWHSHEMLFGFSMAVVTGFLLTAVQHWTGLPTTDKTSSVVLLAIWLAGRILPLSVPLPLLGAIADLLFLPALGYFVAKPIFKVKQKQNYVYPALLAGLVLANVLIHLEKLGITSDTALQGTYLAFNLVVLMIIIFGGRIFPMFTMAATRTPVTQRKLINWLGNGSVAALALGQFFSINTHILLFLAGVAAISNGFRLAGWYNHKIWKKPIVWILHLGYAWLVLGFALTVVGGYFAISPFLAMHALAAGGIGVSTLGMMVRVSLGHTGRLLEPSRWLQAAFVFINAAAVVRVFLPLIWPESYAMLVVISAILWSLAFALFTGSMLPVLTKSRPDGKQG